MRDDGQEWESSKSPTNSSSSPPHRSELKSSDSGDSSESSRTADVLNMLGKRRDDKQVPRRTSAALKCWNITENELRKYFHLPLSRVAKELCCSRTSLKKICRKNGIQRWPCRHSGRRRDEERSKSELSTSSGDGRDGRPDDMGDRDPYFAPSRPTKATPHAPEPQEQRTGGYWHGVPTSYQLDRSEGARRRTALQPSMEQVGAFSPVVDSRIMMYGSNNAIHERPSSEHVDYMLAQPSMLWQGFRHPFNGTASHSHLPPIHGAQRQHGAGQPGGGNDLPAPFSPTATLSIVDMNAMLRMRMEGSTEDGVRKRMTAAMKLGETRALLKDIASLVPPDARLINAMEAVDVLISSVGAGISTRYGDYIHR